MFHSQVLANNDFRSLLIVEDEEALRAELVSLFEHRGWRVASAADLRSAEDILALPDSSWNVLSDVRLPDGNGLDLLRYTESAAGPSGSVHQIAFMTGHTDLTDQVAHSLKGRGIQILTKPVSVRMLLTLFPC